jgi:shikimate kinase/3-dehydroquinate synthase
MSGIRVEGRLGGRGAVVLCGPMGAGKTTVGAEVAAAFGLPFFDVDRMLAERWGPIPDQFTRDGEAAFRQREREVVLGLLGGDPGDRRGASPAVIALGGGGFSDSQVRTLACARALTVWLDVPLDVSLSRIAGSDRPNGSRAAQLFEARRRDYASAEVRVDASAPVVDVVAAIVAACPLVRQVQASRLTYRVVATGGGYGDLAAEVQRIGCSDAVIVTDDRIGPLWASAVAAAVGVACRTVVVPAGEASKSWSTLGRLIDDALAGGVRRSTAVIALGGGMVGDLAGLCAALLLRGVPVVQVPTSLLAMVDSSVGGKTAINHEKAKNLIGAFYPPSLVYASMSTLATLPPAELRSGLGEVVKTALLDAALFARVEALADRLAVGEPGALREVVLECVRVKAAIVEQDERETGVRAWLNLGHTVGHGLEAASEGAIPHGVAVAAGLLAELRWSAAAGYTDSEVFSRVSALLARLGLPGPLVPVRGSRVVDAMWLDKKASGDTLSLPVVVRVGEVAVVGVPLTELASMVEPA